ncbi:MAG: DUF2339 domain-containing protein [Algibacter sp.]
MEIILLIAIIIILIIQLTKYNNDRTSLNREINSLNEKLNNLHRLLVIKQAPKTVEKEPIKDVIEKVVPSPIETPVKAVSVIQKVLDKEYIPIYPNVNTLSEKDAGVIEKILKTAKASNDYETLTKLRNKMIEVLEISEVKEKSDIEFISTILKDYNHYADKKQSVGTPPVVLETKKQEPVQPIKAADSARTITAPTPAKQVVQEPTLSLWERFKQRNPDLEKFIGENLINKIGILILVLGISYFVKYAIDKDWINEPARVGIGILAGSLVLFIAHKLRQKYAPFSSVLVAGAIAIFYFTISIAFHEYKLFGQEVAFAIMVVITAFSCLISLSYNRMELAILSLIGGFLVPFMISTGSGNYIVLFIYIAILDIGILALAYFKKWQLLHMLAFVFTMLLFGAWVVKDVSSETPHYLGALIFAFAFYLIFIVINIINNLREKGLFSKIQLAMLTINNFVFYGLGILVLSKFKPELLGGFTAVLALLNMSYSLLLYKKYGLDKRGVYLLIGLSLTFITLAIPVQFSGNNITFFWAIEAVLLMWLAQKSQIKSYRFTSVIVQFLMLGSLALDWLVYMSYKPGLSIVINPIFIAGGFVIASLVVVNYLLRHETEVLKKFGLTFNPIYYRKVTRNLAIITGYLVGFIEVIYQSYLYLDFTGVLSTAILYHLLFSTVFCFIIYRHRNSSNDKMVNVIAIVNIVGFTLLCAKIPFTEFQDNIAKGTTINIAYYLHMLSLVFIVYLWYLVYTSNKTEKVFPSFNNKWILWYPAVVLVIIASNEIILQGLHIMEFSIDKLQTSSAYVMISDAKHKIIKTGLPVLWGILSFAFLLWGIKKQIKQLRIIALALLGLTIVKLFVYDISNVSETGKIIAFILLGILILVISFIYQKIKVLVIDEDKTTEDDKID